MKTVADLKRYLKVGARATMTYNWSAVQKHPMPWEREVVKVQTNGVFFVDPTDPESKKSFFDFPKADEVRFVKDDGCVLVQIIDNMGQENERHVMTYQILDSWM